MSDNEQLKREFTDDERRRLVDYFSLLIEIDQQEKARYAKLKDSPTGYPMDGEGRQCGLCFKSVYDTPGWFDKWGFKCMNCQDAVNKKKTPGSLCRDHDHKKYVTEFYLSHISGLHHRTIQKLIKQGRIITRQVPKGPALILRKDNPHLIDVIESERS